MTLQRAIMFVHKNIFFWSLKLNRVLHIWFDKKAVCVQNMFYCKVRATLEQKDSGVSNTRPAGHIRPARVSNAAREHQKKSRFERKNWAIFLIFPNKLIFNTQFKNFIFMRPARPYFESHAARESLWVWDPWFNSL